MTNPACPFCNFNQSEVTVFADDHVQAFISLGPINRYHVLVVPRVHYERLAEVPHDILMSVMRVVQRVSVAVATVARPDAVSHLSDDDLTGSGFNLVAHWKMHVIPRYRNDAVVVDWHREPDPGAEVRARYGRELRQALPGAPITGKAGV
jgi:histidine triad (HIT) family protein